MVMWLRQADDAVGRVGVVASKRTFRRAVDRGRAKRRLREAFRLGRRELPAGLDVVLVARHRILSGSFEDIQTELRKLCRRAQRAGGPRD